MSEAKGRVNEACQGLREAGLRTDKANELEVPTTETDGTGAGGLGSEAAEAATAPPICPDFHVRDRNTANWLVRRILECRRYGASVADWAAAETRRAQQEECFWLDRYGLQLEEWAAAELAQGQGRRRRSIALPAGTVGFRQRPPSLQITDEPALLTWLTDNLPEAVKLAVEVIGKDALSLQSWIAAGHCEDAKVGRHVLKAMLARHVQATGECPPGLQVHVGTTFYVS